MSEQEELTPEQREKIERHLTPVLVRNADDIRALAEEMKTVCRADPVGEPTTASPNEQVAMERASRMGDSIMESGHVRVLAFLTPDKTVLPVTVELTLDHYTTPHRWDLSMSIPQGSSPMRVPDPLAPLIAGCFLGENPTEIPPVGAFKNVRQFVKETEE